MSITTKEEGGYFMTKTVEYSMELPDGDAVRVMFEDGHGNPNFVIDVSPNEAVTVKTHAELKKIKEMLDAAWEHWVNVEKKGKA